ncbi:MAG: hypothetical protein JO163_15660 [Methylobacteriaceae bacterium]|nr:hypothetical protein [Methylobacteriaceae bacterium]
MGHGRWDASAWARYAAAHTAGKAANEIFTARGMKSSFDPAKIAVRESRDSGFNPDSTAIILASDVTGSMGEIAEVMIRSGLDTTMREIYDRKPVTDPHVMIMAVGDAECDQAPLQATQFEADIRLAEQLKDIWIEGGGGGNGGESYHLPWYFAATKTSIDCFEKRGKKGYLFTIGDEPILPGIARQDLRRVFADGAERDMTSANLLAMASRSYEVFHVLLTRVGYATSNLNAVLATWAPLLGERLIKCDDHQRVAEVIVSAIQVAEGADRDAVAHSWSGSTAVTVANAIRTLVPTSAPPARPGVVRFI